MSKPVIGITLDYHIDDDSFSYSAFPWYALRCDYSKVISKMGAIPVLLSYEHEIIDEVLDHIDGLIISGGDYDIPPAAYGQEVISKKVYSNDVRWNYEKKLLKAALERKMPFLGICNGMQVMNVLYGGTLYQDIDEQHDKPIPHKQPHPKNEPYHKIDLIDGTMLVKMSGGVKEHMVNSTHHQSVDKPGHNIVVSARASDGIIEAIELPGNDFALGVQWHAEYLTCDLDRLIFEHFIAASAHYKK